MRQRSFIYLLAALMCIAACSKVLFTLNQSETIFLEHSDAGQWIKHPAPATLYTRVVLNEVWFIVMLDARQLPDKLNLNLHAKDWCMVFLDGKPIYQSPKPFEILRFNDWWYQHKTALDLLPSKDWYQLAVRVLARSSDPSLMVYSDNDEILSNAAWRVSNDRKNWLPTEVFSMPQTSSADIQATRAQWLKPPRTLKPLALAKSEQTRFRTQFQLTRAEPAASLEFDTLQTAQIYLDGELVYEKGQHIISNEKGAKSITLPPLETGTHTLTAVVSNDRGLPVFRAYSQQLGLATDKGWVASNEANKDWEPAAFAYEHGLRTPAHAPAWKIMLEQSFWIAPVLLGALLLVLFQNNHSTNRFRTIHISALHFKWLMILAWLLLAWNNFSQIPDYMGYDTDFHIEYIRYLDAYHQLPLATDGWQMFQSPLYYLISAVIYKLLLNFTAEMDVLIRLLRLLSVLCAIAQIELVFRSARLLFPDRAAIQILATAIAGFMPMSIYMSQMLGNEPLAGCLTALTIYLALRWLVSSEVSYKLLALTGIAWGLALLTKLTPLLLAPFLAIALVYKTPKVADIHILIMRGSVLLGMCL
ncbi:MAG: glycosyltransferase family 39 protein, partial [Pseudomonadota bacterium]